MLPPLSTLLDYRHPQVIQSYVRTYNESEEKAIDLFTGMLKYLWLARKHSLQREEHPHDEALNFKFVMHEEMRAIDNMWHNFILYTQDYTAFCQKYFGLYIHHEPDIAIGEPEPQEDFAQDLEKYLSYAYDNLGEETIRQWFGAYFD